MLIILETEGRYNWSETDGSCTPPTWLFIDNSPQGGFGNAFSEDILVISLENGAPFEVTSTGVASIDNSRIWNGTYDTRL